MARRRPSIFVLAPTTAPPLERRRFLPLSFNGHGAAGALEQTDVEDALYAAVANGLVADDGDRQCWTTIRSGLGAGLREPIDLDANRRARGEKVKSRAPRRID